MAGQEEGIKQALKELNIHVSEQTAELRETNHSLGKIQKAIEKAADAIIKRLDKDKD